MERSDSISIIKTCLLLLTGKVLTDEEVEKLIESKAKNMNLPSNFVLNSDGSYDVDGDVEVTKNMVKDGKLTIKFGKVSGYFDCNFNDLTSLEGCPKVVGSSFWCGYNNLTSLEGCPKVVGGNFYCNFNKLPSLNGAPNKVERDFDCSYNTKKFTEDDVRRLCNVKCGIIYA